ncbi:MAG: type II toxin-antitoxin system HicA family toxin [bacterium]|nr:type II toxin-antitoxin system HicA family toxin [bacterium]
MPRLIPLKPRELEKLLLQNGFVLNHVVGSHKQYFNPKTKSHITVPFHSKQLAIGTFKSIIKQSQLPIVLFRK